MNWSNATVLEFIELIREEPVIWHPEGKRHKNKNLVQEAWVRIARKFSEPCSIEYMKKKRNSLMTQYRDYLKKIKELLKIEGDAEKTYRPTWFAFNAIHSYMGPIYDCDQDVSTEFVDSKASLSFTQNNTHSTATYLELSLSPDYTIKRSESLESDSASGLDSPPDIKRPREDIDPLTTKKQDFEYRSKKQNKRTETACDLYGKLLAEKLKVLSVDDGLMLMNEIDNLVFKYIMDVRKQGTLRELNNLESNS